MKPSDRQREIAAAVLRDGPTSVETLAARHDVSVETIRRDLSRLARDGRVLKTHGWARPPAQRLVQEPALEQRMRQDVGPRRQIALKLAAEIRPGDALFLDTGATTLSAAEALAEADGLAGGLMVATNSLGVARILGRAGARVMLLGGDYAPGNDQTVGPRVIEEIGRCQFDHAVLTVAALDPEAGAMDADPGEAEIARAMIARAGRTVVLAAGAKMMRRAAFRVCPLERIDLLISDAAPPPAMQAALDAAGAALR